MNRYTFYNLLPHTFVLLVTILPTFSFAQSNQNIDSSSGFFKAQQREKLEIIKSVERDGITKEYEELLELLKKKVISEKNNPQWIHTTSFLFRQAKELLQAGWTVSRIQEMQKHGIDVYADVYDTKSSLLRKVILLSPLLLEARVIKTTHPDTISSKDFFTTSTILKVIRVFKGHLQDSIIVLRQQRLIASEGIRTGTFLERGKQFIFPLYSEQYRKGVDRWNRSNPQGASMKPRSNYYANSSDFYLCTHDKALYPLWEKTPNDEEFLTWINYIPQQATQAQIEEIQSLSKIINEAFQKTR